MEVMSEFGCDKIEPTTSAQAFDFFETTLSI
jgi:hypothetical protein